jgi:predicted GTPase
VNAKEPIGYGVDPADQQHLDVAASRGLARLLNESATCFEAKILERLNSLRGRLATDRFQLAVLGQFKRGKSAVLNALLGQSVLPIGVERFRPTRANTRMNCTE